MTEKHEIDGFCVSGLALASIAFIARFYWYIARNVNIQNPVHVWYNAIFPGSPILLLLAIVFLVIGFRRSRREGNQRSKSLAVIGLVIASLALVHVLGLGLFYRLMRGFA